MQAEVRRFACTACGKCCNRSPEVELSEAAALADQFVFRLMFRLYSLPRRFTDHHAAGSTQANASAIFYEKKRLLSAFAARKYAVKLRRGGKTVEATNYLTISALSLDTVPGACAALSGPRCSIYERRPLACRTVPFHYSRPAALAVSDLATFVATPGFECDTRDSAAIVIENGRIVHAPTQRLRAEALSVVERDRPWHDAIVREVHASPSSHSARSSINIRMASTRTMHCSV